MSGMTRSARAIGTERVAVLEVSLVKRVAIQIGDLLANLNGILEGTFFLGKLLNEGTEGATTRDGI